VPLLSNRPARVPLHECVGRVPLPREHKRYGITNEQLYFAVALPLLGNAFAVGVLMWLLKRLFTSMK
jgi:hypothetical protein